MELYNLKFSHDVRFDLEDIEDYNIKGTFDPNASCDTEFFGYRETTFNISNVEFFDQELKVWWSYSPETIDEFKIYYDDKLTLIVQDAIDDKQGEL